MAGGALKKWLVENAGVSGSRITTRGWGEAKPVAPNKNPDGSDNPAFGAALSQLYLIVFFGT